MKANLFAQDRMRLSLQIFFHLKLKTARISDEDKGEQFTVCIRVKESFVLKEQHKKPSCTLYALYTIQCSSTQVEIETLQSAPELENR